MPRPAGPLLACLALLASPLHAQAPPTGPTFQAFIFGDVNFSATDKDDDEAFRVGQTVIHGNATLTDRVLFFAEMSITGGNRGYGLEMERAILRYDVSDALKLSGGRYHTPISYWNTAYHHGLWLQGSVARPEPVRFGSRFIPVHFVGIMAEGQLPDSPFHYAVGLGNGHSTVIARAGDGGDVNDTRAVIASASVRPGNLLGFRVGAGLYLDHVPTDDGIDADERIVSTHAVWDRGRLELVGEYIRVRHEDGNTGRAATSDGWYVHAGVRVAGTTRPVTPYLRIERMEMDETDTALDGNPPDYEAVVAGFRWDFDELTALKLEYRREEIGGGEALDAFWAQASFAVPLLGG